MRSVRVRAPAKVNLALRVMAREEGGYHQLETVFQALDLADEVFVRPSGVGVRLEIDGPEPCPMEQNLAFRAARAYLAGTGIAQGVEIHLRKRLPAGGGLGGGSSDAAAVLRALNYLYEGEMTPEGLAGLAGQLGADVPFFLSPSPLALAWGRGDRMLPLPPLPSAPVLLALPGFSVSTPEAFRRLAATRQTAGSPRPTGTLNPDRLTTWQGVGELAVNDFHGPVFEMSPALGELHVVLDRPPARFALLSGSGSSFFAVYETAADRDDALARHAALFPEVTWVGAGTLAEMPTIDDGVDWPGG